MCNHRLEAGAAPKLVPVPGHVEKGLEPSHQVIVPGAALPYHLENFTRVLVMRVLPPVQPAHSISLQALMADALR